MHDNYYLKTVKRLIRKTEKIGDCFIWTGSKNTAGYGQLSVENKKPAVHRLAAHLFRNIPLYNSDTQVLHKPECTSKACWNPEHTYDGTPGDNTRDCIEAGKHIAWGWRH